MDENNIRQISNAEDRIYNCFDECTCHPPGTVFDDCLGSCALAKLRAIVTLTKPEARALLFELETLQEVVSNNYVEHLLEPGDEAVSSERSDSVRSVGLLVDLMREIFVPDEVRNG
jgi:hypothetical protein